MAKSNYAVEKRHKDIAIKKEGNNGSGKPKKMSERPLENPPQPSIDETTDVRVSLGRPLFHTYTLNLFRLG